MTRTRLAALLPIAAFVLLGLLFWRGLSGDPGTLPSVLLNKPVPAFALDAIPELGVPGLKDADLKQGKITVVNIWGSWCGPCRTEHPVLMQLSKRNDINLVGINNKDEPENARRFLGTLGQPFTAIGADPNGRTTIDWGGYGVPETFVIDGNGIIRHKHVGPLLNATVLDLEIQKAAQPLP
jgi:cytochrome c biogenesis protein CcmG, thiol:disulfide interchange protein DsbE